MVKTIIWMAHSGDLGFWSSCICMSVLLHLLFVFIWEQFRIKFTVIAPRCLLLFIPRKNPTYPAHRGAGSLRVNQAKQFLLAPNILRETALGGRHKVRKNCSPCKENIGRSSTSLRKEGQDKLRITTTEQNERRKSCVVGHNASESSPSDSLP